MSEVKFTPGPWFPTCYAGYWEICDGPCYESAPVLNEDDYPNAEANAKLAAAAPELLDALQEIMRFQSSMETVMGLNLQSPENFYKAMDKAEKAIKSATE